MRIEVIFQSINAGDFEGQTDWWTKLIGRGPDAKPMPSCNEWTLREGVLFQVLDNANGEKASVSLLIVGLDDEIARLAKLGIAVPAPGKVPGFEALYATSFVDPEGNAVTLLEGA